MVVDAVTPAMARLCIAGTAKVGVVDGQAIATAFLGFAVSALVSVVDGVTRATVGFCFAGAAKIGVVDSGAATASGGLLGAGRQSSSATFFSSS